MYVIVAEPSNERTLARLSCNLKKKNGRKERKGSKKETGFVGAGLKPALLFDPFVSIVPFLGKTRRNFYSRP